jgi:hypothetical protein
MLSHNNFICLKLLGVRMSRQCFVIILVQHDTFSFDYRAHRLIRKQSKKVVPKLAQSISSY